MPSTMLFETSSTRITLARPLMNACVACVTSHGGMIENPIFVPTLSRWLTTK